MKYLKKIVLLVIIVLFLQSSSDNIDERISYGDWRDIDINCSKPDVIIDNQTWAGCNLLFSSFFIRK